MKIQRISCLWIGLALFGIFLLSGCQSTTEPDFKDKVQEALDHFYRGERYERNGDLDRAEEEYIASLDISPRPVTYYRLAQIQITRDELASAKENLQKALDLSPNYSAAKQRLRQLRIMSGEEVEKEKPRDSLISETSETDTESSEKTDTTTDGEELLNQIMDIDQESEQVDETVAIEEAEDVETVSTQEKEDEKIQDINEKFADNEMEQDIEEPRVPKKDQEQDMESTIVSPEMKEALNQKNWDHAVDVGKRLIAENPEQPIVHYNMGIAYIQLRQFGKAEDSFRQAIEYKPNFADAYNDLGVVLDYVGNKSDAAKCYQQAIQISKHADAYFNLAKIREKEGDYKLAIDLYEKYLEHGTQDSYAEYAQERINKLRRLAY